MAPGEGRSWKGPRARTASSACEAELPAGLLGQRPSPTSSARWARSAARAGDGRMAAADEKGDALADTIRKGLKEYMPLTQPAHTSTWTVALPDYPQGVASLHRVCTTAV